MPNIDKQRALDVLLPAIAVAAGTIFPRLMVSGNLPATDEGIYAYQAFIAHKFMSMGLGLPDQTTFMLHSILSSWIFHFDINHFIGLRLLDLVVSVFTSIVLYRVVLLQSGDRVFSAATTLLFLLLMNNPVFIQHGYKNPIFAAFLPLLAAVALSFRENLTSVHWMVVGGLVAIATLLREPLAVYAAFGFVAVFIAHGFRPALYYSLGGMLTGAVLMAALMIARGSISGVVYGYTTSGDLYAAMEDKRWYFFTQGGWKFMNEAYPALIIVGTIVVLSAFTPVASKNRGRYAFWIVAGLLPLIEPLSKYGVPYHFAVALPAMAGLTALAWRTADQTMLVRPLLALMLAGGLIAQAPTIAKLLRMWPETSERLASLGSVDWPEKDIDRSNYLLAAKAIKDNARPGSTLAVSGLMHGLFPLSGVMPASTRTADLTVEAIRMDLDVGRLRQSIAACPPRLIFATSRTGWPGAGEIREAVTEGQDYDFVFEVPVTRTRSYGNFGGSLFVSKAGGTTAAPPEDAAPEYGRCLNGLMESK